MTGRLRGHCRAAGGGRDVETRARERAHELSGPVGGVGRARTARDGVTGPRRYDLPSWYCIQYPGGEGVNTCIITYLRVLSAYLVYSTVSH